MAATDEFFVEVQEDYVAVVADEKAQAGAPSGPEAVGDLSGEIETSGFFDNVAVRRYLWDVTYTSEEYISVLDTYSGHRALDAATRELLYERIRGRIERRPDGTVRKTYLATLNVAQLRRAAAG